MSILLLQLSVLCYFSQIQIKETLCENRVNPIGLDIPQPALSWQMVSAVRNTMQNAYEVRVAMLVNDLTKGNNLVWKTGKILSNQSVHIAYSGSMLQSAKKYYWQVNTKLILIL